MAVCMRDSLHIAISEEEQGAVTDSISPLSPLSSPTPSCEDLEADLQGIAEEAEAPPAWKKRKRLTKQLSMTSETPRDIAWERRRRQILRQGRRSSLHDVDDLTDEDLHELKGCIELGFGFNEEDGQTLCNTLPALDLYFAVNRQVVTPSPASTPHSQRESHSRRSSFGGHSSSFGSPRISSADSDCWKICSPGDDPQHVKTKLRHWAQAVACSVMQSH